MQDMHMRSRVTYTEAGDHVPTQRWPVPAKGTVRQLEQDRYEYIQHMPCRALAVICATIVK